MATVSLAPALRAAIVSRMTTLAGTGVLVTRGLVAFDTFDDVIVIGRVSSSSEPANFGTQRQREETLECEVVIYSFRAGGDEQESIVETQAYYLLGLLENYVRATDPTLGVDGVRHCFLTDHESDTATDPDVLSKGRLHIIRATFTAAARLTS